MDRAQSYLRVRRRNLPDFGMSPRGFLPRHDIPSWMAGPDNVRREVFAECVGLMWPTNFQRYGHFGTRF